MDELLRGLVNTTDAAAGGAVGAGQRHDPPLSPSGPYLYGNGGLFETSGTDGRIFSAMMAPLSGLMNELPVINGGLGSDNMFGAEMQETMTIMTGMTAGAADDFANQPTGDCADGPVGGLIKLCEVINSYGRYRFSTREVSMYRAGQRRDYASDLTLRLMNQPRGFAGSILTPTATPSATNVLLNEIASRIWETVMSAQRMFAPRLYTGSPVNNNGEAKDIMGLDMFINENQLVDKNTAQVCTAANSDVKSFNFNLVGGAVDIVRYVETVDDYIMWNATQQGLTPYTYWLVMRPELWRELSAVWPMRQYYDAIAQMTGLGANINLNISGRDTLEDRNEIRRSLRLPINGRMVQVVLDDSIPYTKPAQNAALSSGQYASTIYFVPKTVLGGIPVTFWKFYNHANAQAEAIEGWVGNNNTFSSDGGLFRWYVAFKNGCMKLTFEFSPKLMMLTPQLAGRIDKVSFQPMQKYREWDPTSDYFFNGGKTSGQVPTFYTPWSKTTPVQVT